MSNEYYSGINNIRDSNSHFVVVVGVVAVIVFVIVETIVVLGIIVDVIVVLVFKILVTLLILMRVVISGVIVLLICWGPLLGYCFRKFLSFLVFRKKNIGSNSRSTHENIPTCKISCQTEPYSAMSNNMINMSRILEKGYCQY